VPPNFIPDERDHEARTPPRTFPYHKITDEDLDILLPPDPKHDYACRRQHSRKIIKIGQKLGYLLKRLPTGSLIHIAKILPPNRLESLPLRRYTKRRDLGVEGHRGENEDEHHLQVETAVNPTCEQFIEHMWTNVRIAEVVEEGGTARVHEAIMEKLLWRS
jgi:hypothetical protein